MKAKLTPERKAVRDAQESKWFDGSAGAATSWPYRVKRWLSPELSDKITAEVKAMVDKWTAKLESVKPSKRFIRKDCCGGTWCEELSAQQYSTNNKENVLETEVLRHKIYVKVLDSYKMKNGQWGIKPLDKPVVKFDHYANTAFGPYGSYDLRELGLGYDETAGRWYITQYHRAKNTPIEITKKNWARGAKRREFMAEVEKLEDSLTKDGVTIGELKDCRTTLGYVRGLEDTYVDCAGPEVTA